MTYAYTNTDKRRSRLQLRLSVRFYIIIALILCLALGIMLIKGSITLAGQRAKLAELTESRTTMQQKVSDLKRQANFSETDEYVIRQARLRGMIFPGETRYTRTVED